MADCSIFASGWVADGGAALPGKAASRSPSSLSQDVYMQCSTGKMWFVMAAARS